MAAVSKVIIFPIKSLPGVEVDQCEFTQAGSLKGDREFAFQTQDGKVVNAKKYDKIHTIDAKYDLAARTVTLWSSDKSKTTFHLDEQREELCAWISNHLGIPGIKIKQDAEKGLPDDPDSPGPTLVSQATLIAAGKYFDPPLGLEEMRRRIRANIEIDGPDVPAYTEDKFYGEEGVGRIVTLGEAELIVTGPCQRCIVPTRDSQTGIPTAPMKLFAAQFSDGRRASLPEDVVASRFDKNAYRLTVNGLGPQGGTLHVGDSVEVGPEVELRDFKGKTSTLLKGPPVAPSELKLGLVQTKS